ncbi:hypothetical protein [Arcanobacterium pinnipediorum]|nr:hypothetical protein [Arcanobacterium pinnipediorum]
MSHDQHDESKLVVARVGGPFIDDSYPVRIYFFEVASRFFMRA